MRLRFFGRLRDAVGTAETECDPPSEIADSEALRRWLGEGHPVLLDETVRIALDNQMVQGNAPLDGVAEASFLPPVSGG